MFRAMPLTLLLPGLILSAAIAPSAAHAVVCSSQHILVMEHLGAGKSIEVFDHGAGKTFQMTELPGGKAQSVAKVKEELKPEPPSDTIDEPRD
jgi:hypothetical protein